MRALGKILLPTCFDALALVLALACGGGGGGGTTPSGDSFPVTVSISPISVNLSSGGTQQFSATVANTLDTSVTWSVQETGGGSISASGFYTAPSSLTSVSTFHVVATSHVDPNRSATATVTIIDPGAYYVLYAKHSGKVLDVYYGAIEDGANVQQWTANGTDAQKWKFSDAGDGYYYISVKCSGKYLDVLDASTADGANVQQWAFTGSDGQKWKIEHVDNEYYFIQAKCSGKVLDVEYGSLDNGANVSQYTYHGGVNQLWKLEKASD